METETITKPEIDASKYTKYLFVKPGSAIINRKIGELLKEFNVGYAHMYEGNPREKEEIMNGHKNLKIKAGNTYTFTGKTQNLERLYSSFNNLVNKILEKAKEQ